VAVVRAGEAVEVQEVAVVRPEAGAPEVAVQLAGVQAAGQPQPGVEEAAVAEWAADVAAVVALRLAVRVEAGAAVGPLLTPLPDAGVLAWVEDNLAHQDNNFGQVVAMEAGGMGGAISTAARA
jgi:hypothetical protein